MYDYIKGILTHREQDTVVVEAGGIGYCIVCANPADLVPGKNQEVLLYLHQHIREDAHMLYGFRTREERRMFRLLLEVSGIGPKGAMSVLASSSPQEIALAIVREDVSYLTRFPGIGPKTAKRLILDLKDKLKREGLDRQEGPERPDCAARDAQGQTPSFLEAVEALLVLGFREEEALPAVKEIIRCSSGMPTEEIVREALRRMNRC